MSTLSLSRRGLARWALASAAVACLPASAAAVPPSTMNDTPKALGEGDLLAQAVPAAAGYALSETQAHEVALALKDYPGPFRKARAFAIPDDVAPAFAPLPPLMDRRRR